MSETGKAETALTRYRMSMLDRRLQVLIDDDRWSRLEEEAGRRGVSVGALVREAIDERFPSRSEEQRAALRSVLGAAAMDVPSPDELHRELDSIRARQSS
ncbi:MAG: ribbon-helix-helix protein, CopG family [Acidimicrobiales bacterium]